MGAHTDFQHISTDEAVKLIMTASPGDVCNEMMGAVQCNVLFLAHFKTDTERLDLIRDDMGVWNRGHRGKPEIYDSRSYTRSSSGDLEVRRAVFQNSSAPDLKRTEIYVVRKFANNNHLIPPYFTIMPKPWFVKFGSTAKPGIQISLNDC